MNEKCAMCIHCEVCGFIESEVAKNGSCAFYEDGKRWELTKEEKALLQKWRDNRGISMKDFEDAMDALKQEPKFIAKSDGTIEQIKNCDDCIFRKEWEKIGKLLSVILKKQTEQEPCDDAIDRKLVCAFIDGLISDDGEREKGLEYIRHLPPVTPQPKTDVLDKIRAEIAEYGSIMVSYAITKGTKTDKGIEKLVNGVLKQAKEQVLEIIDKYKAESEETETWNGIHAQITAPKGTFERIFNDADDDNDI